MVMTYDPDHPNPTDLQRVRLLINDVDPARPVFTDVEIRSFLDMADGAVLLAAAQALDTIADNEVLTSKVIRTQDLQTDGARVADALRKRADSLRAQHDDLDGGFFDVIGTRPAAGPELGPHDYLGGL